MGKKTKEGNKSNADAATDELVIKPTKVGRGACVCAINIHEYQQIGIRKPELPTQCATPHRHRSLRPSIPPSGQSSSKTMTSSTYAQATTPPSLRDTHPCAGPSRIMCAMASSTSTSPATPHPTRWWHGSNAFYAWKRRATVVPSIPRYWFM